MFCYQCEQTAGGTGCQKIGVCGKNDAVAHGQDVLTAKLIALATLVQNKEKIEEDTLALIEECLFVTITNVNFNEEDINEWILKVEKKIAFYGGIEDPIKAEDLFTKGDSDIVSLRSTLMFGLRGMAAYAWHAHVLGKDDDEVSNWFVKGLFEFAKEHTVDEWLGLLMEFGMINLKCMELLDAANTGAYGTPVPTNVSTIIEPGPFIVISGHDLHDLKQLLEQTEGKGINIYTHGEMLPAHGYPKLKKYSHLKSNFGTAWQNQQKEFANIKGPVLFTTNCLMPVRDNYSGAIFTTEMVSYPGLTHIESDENGNKDFTPVIEKALELKGYDEPQNLTGINGGQVLTTGFGHGTVLAVADKVIDEVKAGAIKHFFLVGGCDGAKPGRNYYTKFVEQTPDDTIILTLACGKFRFNDLQIGEIDGLPRIMDMGQCNDAYSAIKVAVALAQAFECSVNDLPLTLVLSWYEQKAVCILLTLLALGIKNIYIGPSIPAFFSSNVLNVLVDKFGVTPISTPEADLKTILG